MDVVRTVADQVAVLRAGAIVESGSVRDLIADPLSQIGKQLLPVRPTISDEHDTLIFEVTYGTRRTVPSDWVSLLTEKLRARVGLLGGVVEDIGGASSGRLHISVSLQGHQHEAEDVTAYLHSLGLHAKALNATPRTQFTLAKTA
jgi:D-methionine transport system ATP-binding protein